MAERRLERTRRAYWPEPLKPLWWLRTTDDVLDELRHRAAMLSGRQAWNVIEAEEFDSACDHGDENDMK